MHGDCTKRLVLVVGFMFLWAAGVLDRLCRPRPGSGTPQVNLPETAYNFGKVSEEQPLSHTFIIRIPARRAPGNHGCGPGLQLHRAA